MFKNKYFKGTIAAVAVFGLLLGGVVVKNKVFTSPKYDTLRIDSAIPFLDDKELSSTSPVIIEGEVTSIDSAKWNNSDGTEPTNITSDDILYKDNLIKVTKVIKGNPGSVVKVRTYGGDDLTSKNVKHVICDSYGNFNTGEKVLLFLTYDDSNYNKSKSNDYYVLRGMNQGKYLIIKDKVQNPHGSKLKSALDDTIANHKEDVIVRHAPSPKERLDQ